MPPDKPRRNKAIEFHNQAMAVVGHDKQLAYRLLCSATTVDPGMASGWYMMGNACADLKMLPASIAAFRRVLDCPEGDASIGGLTPELRAKSLVNLGHRLVNNGEIAEAEEWSRRALDYAVANPELDQEGRAFAWTNLSLIETIQGRVGEALDHAQEAFRQSQEPIIETGLAFAHLFNGDYATGLKHFEARFAYRLPQYLSYPYPRWNGEQIDGTLFVASDQGLGDSLAFARFIRAAAKRCARVVFQVQPELFRLLQGGLAGLTNVTVEPASTIFPIADAWCPVMSLPVTLGLTNDVIVNWRQRWDAPHGAVSLGDGWKAPDAKLHVGISYAGSPLNEIDRWRSIPPDQFLALYQVPGVQLYSLQVGERVADLHASGMAALARDLSPWIRDATDTAAIIRQLDLVITIESFLGHLAGALNAECWVLCSRRGQDFRHGVDRDSPLWYPRSRIFRQGHDYEWGPVFDAVVAALRERVG